MAIPSSIITFIVATLLQKPDSNRFDEDDFNADGSSNAFNTEAISNGAQLVMSAFTLVMIFVLYNRSRTSYNRWWEGGTLLQKTRGEWFNAYSSIMAFCTTKPELQDEVKSYCHLVARLFSLLMCCGLQQVSPHRDRPFEIIDLAGIDPESMELLNSAPDKVEVILQWIQRSMVLHMQTGVLPIAPPVLSRAFQEVSRGIVNLQNARKIADFPYPYPLAQVSMILQLLHYAMTPLVAALALPRPWAVCLAFLTIFGLWCIHFNALDLEFPFGSRVNDLPMNEFQQEWNNSIITLLDERAAFPPEFIYKSELHDSLDMVMSDASEIYVPSVPPPLSKGNAVIRVLNRELNRMASITGSRSVSPSNAPTAASRGSRTLFAGSRPAQQAAGAYVRPSRASDTMQHMQSGSSRAAGEATICTHLTERSELQRPRGGVPEPQDDVVTTGLPGESEGQNGSYGTYGSSGATLDTKNGSHVVGMSAREEGLDIPANGARAANGCVVAL